MDYIKFALAVLFVIVIYIGITKICMWVANDVGEKLGVGKSLIYLFRKNKKNKN
jgi:hypothetical protein